MMKWLVLLVTHGLLASSFYIRGKREADNDTTDSQPGGSANTRSASFYIDDFYPTKTEIVLKKEVSIEFNCSSTKPWFSCGWKAPFETGQQVPCAVDTSGDVNFQDCSRWDNIGNFQVRRSQIGGLNVCSIHGKIGYDSRRNDEGEWSCTLQDSNYQHLSKEFNLLYLKPAAVRLERGSVTRMQAAAPEEGSSEDHRRASADQEVELGPEDQVELTCKAERALPEASIVWYINKQRIDFDSPLFTSDFKLLKDPAPTSSYGTFSSSQTILYTARLEHNSKYIRCVAQQTDDEGNQSESNNDADLGLLIREFIPAVEPGVSMAMIGSIIGFIIILCLAILFLVLAWYSKSFCFRKEHYVVHPLEKNPPVCPGCRDHAPLMSSQHIHTCEIATGTDPDDQVNKITKYQTEIILVTDKLVGNPSSVKTVEDFDRWTQALGGMMQGMANKETDDALKNRFLLAAQGLTSSVGALMGAAEKSAASPHSEEERWGARSAGEEVKSTVTQSVDIVRRIHAMKDLRTRVEEVVAAAKEARSTATEVVEEDPASHDILTQAGGDTERETAVLEQVLALYIQTPTSARAQSGLLTSSRGFLQPAGVWLDTCRDTLPQLAYEASANRLRGTAERFTEAVKQLETTVEDTELCVDTLATEEAVEVLQALRTDLELARAQAGKGKLKLLPGESAEQAAAATVEACGSLRSAGASCQVSALAGDRPTMDRAAGEAVQALTQLQGAVRAAAAGAGDKARQELLLDSGLGVLEQAELMLTSARRTVLNPANPVSAQKQVELGEGLSQAVAASLLGSGQGGSLKASQLVAGDLSKELDQFRDALDAFKIRPVPGVSIEQVSKKLDGASDNVGKNVTDLVGSVTRGDEFGSQEAARYVTLALDDYKSAVEAVVSLVTDREVQGGLLDRGQEVLAGASRLLQQADTVLAQPANVEAGRRLREAEGELKTSMKSLEKAYMYGAPGQEQFVSALNIMKHATKELKNPTPTDKKEDIGQLKTRMMTATKEIAGLAHDIQTTAHTEPGEMDGLTFLAQKYKNLATDINQLMEQADDKDMRQETLGTVTSLGKAIMQLIEGTAGQQVRPGQEALLEITTQAQAVAANSVKTLTSVNLLARRAQAMDIIGKNLQGVLHNLDTTIMFASAGTLNVEDESETFGGQREEILKFAQELVTDVQAVLSGSAGTQGELITAAEQSLGNMQQLAERIKSAASCLGPENQEAQVMLLNTAKDVCSNLVDLIHQAKTANGEDISHPAYGQVKNLSKSVIGNITNLLKSVKTFEDESSRGTRAMESSVAAIAQELQLFRSGEGAVVAATPEELIRANRAITQATSRAVAAAASGQQEDLLATANIGRRAIAELLQTCRGAAEGCEDKQLKSEILGRGDELARQYQQLLQMVASGASKEELVTQSRTVANTATALAQLAESLKGSNWVDTEDPIIIAETELLNAAESIEQAALKLSKLRPRGPTAEQKDLENMTFNELIIDSAQSIAKATSGLIKAATEAQRELVAQGKESAETVLGSEAGQWSEGLVSAAKLVASATRSLCEAANNLVTGEGGEEHLIAAAKAVSKSTAQLVMACKVKADGWETSSAMIGLNTASIAVRKATDALVKAARGSIDRESNSKVRVDAYKEMIEADARVIRLQKQVSESKVLESHMKEQSQMTGTVTDIKRARDAENEVQALAKDLQLAISHKARLNEKQYNTLKR